MRDEDPALEALAHHQHIRAELEHTAEEALVSDQRAVEEAHEDGHLGEGHVLQCVEEPTTPHMAGRGKRPAHALEPT